MLKMRTRLLQAKCEIKHEGVAAVDKKKKSLAHSACPM